MSGKSWEQMAREVLVQGRPAGIGDAALGWQELIRNLGQVQESLAQNAKDLGAAWKGPAYDAFRSRIEGLAKEVEAVVTAVDRPGDGREGIVTVLETAARHLEEAQVAMPVPASAVGDVLAARNGEITLETGLFEASLKADWMGSWPVEQIGKFGDWLSEFVFDNTEAAREAYDKVDAQFMEGDMRAPAGPGPHSGLENTPTIPDLNGGPGASGLGGAPSLGGGAPSTGGIGGGVPSVTAGGLPGTGSGAGAGLGSGVHPDLSSGGYGTGGGSGYVPSTGSLGGGNGYGGTGASLAEDYGSGLAGAAAPTTGLGGGFGGGGLSGGGVPGAGGGLGGGLGGAGGAGLAGAGGGMIPGGGALGRPVSPTLPPMMGGGMAGAGRGGGGRGGGALGGAGKLGAGGGGLVPGVGGVAGAGAGAGRGSGRSGALGAGAAGARGGGAGVGGAGGSGAGARGAGGAARGAAGVAGMGPMGGAGYREDQTPRNTWLEEDEDVWGADGDAAPGVLR
ncbi:WXG100 family type VII secretion target [Micromonospora endolithica]|uniref:Uncharacterized protein n=1 Tax=Micromonospora endolithica TaxID=230091 RepID=A0A3A9YZ35_9ACTN|nr:hypothetical protein [Micromonospora endolithica]RKN41120.1 hypothetical protein D7223_25640 [Micromonospora endolithica]TWJ24354.1 hypothetical protein JD76_04504 [Micromonospora endolithica]